MRTKLIMVCIFIIAIVSSLLITLNALPLPNKFNQEDIYEYKIKKDASYKVFLDENQFMNETYMKENQLYISDLIDYITVDFNYFYLANAQTNLEYSYDVIATLYIDYQTTSPMSQTNLLTKQYEIIKNQFLKIENNNQFAIQEDFNIDYNFYKNEVEKFKQEFSIPIDAYLKVQIKINEKTELEKTIEQQDSITLNIKLQDLVTSITKENIGEETKDILKSGEEIGEINKLQLLTGSILTLALISGFLILIRKYAREDEQKNSYENRLEGIQKNYGDILIEITNPVKQTEQLDIIDVKNFNQLIDLENEVRIPILTYEEIKGEKTVFVIVYERIAYRYILQK